MKNCYCPNCGALQVFKLDVASSVSVFCPQCSRSLLVKRNKNVLSVSAQELQARGSPQKKSA